MIASAPEPLPAAAAPAAPARGPAGAIERAIGALQRVPYSILALPLRFAIATVFWNSGTEKLADWNATLELFRDEYKVPLLPPDFAAHLSASIELSTPVLMVLGLLTRPAALVLLGMTTVIEVFVYPQAWPTHIQWAAMLLVLLCRGAGTFSIDELLRRWTARRQAGA
ncbi:MAG TPA: DoxX family protein [Steroidobacteraceae bacterium]|nr:DoxX family protein [Steroidobacteraceae bacterium]